MDITKISPVSFSAETDAQNLNTSIDDVMKNALSKLMAESYLEKSDVLESIANPVNSTDPEKLFEYQKRVQQYNIDISMISALTRKAVNTVDTLLRS